MATRDTYTKVHENWKNQPDDTTPVMAEDLEHIEQGIKDASDKRALREIYNDNAINLGRKYGTTVGAYSTAEGNVAEASGDYSHAEGDSTVASGYRSHAEGYGTKAVGNSSHAEGYSSVAGFEEYPQAAQYGHAEGYETKAHGTACHAEGYQTIAGINPSTSASHAEGYGTAAMGNYSHAEGKNTAISGEGAHAEGVDSQSVGQGGVALHVEGIGTRGIGDAQHVGGKYNVQDGDKAVIVGGGTSDSERRNIYTLDWQGNAIFAGNVQGTYNGKTMSLYGIQMEMEGRYDGINQNLNSMGSALNSMSSALGSLNNRVDGMSEAKVFSTKAELDEWLTVEGNHETLKVGQNIYIKETGTPDYWWDGTSLQVLETDKVVIESMTYDETMAVLNATAEEVA